METNYDLDYFINKFEAIPSNKWCTKKFRKSNKCCAFGHCGVTMFSNETEEGKSLSQIMGKVYGSICIGTMGLMDVNDGKNGYDKLGSTPKERVVNYLKSLK